MAHTGIFATAAQCETKMGANVAAGGKAEAFINQMCAEIESEVNNACRYNFSDNYAGLNADVRAHLQAIESAYVAIKGISYDMSGYTSRIEAEDMINILWDDLKRHMALLKDRKTTTYMKGA